MKKLVTLLFILLTSTIICFGQKEHFCAASKQKSNELKRASSARAMALMNKYDVKFHHLTLDLTKDTNYVAGNVRTIARVTATALDTFVFELQTGMQIDSIKIASDVLIFFRSTNDVYAVLPGTYTTGQDIEITIWYKGYTSGAGSSAIGDGYSDGNSTRWGNAVSWSLSQPFSAYEWFPCKQDLMDKIDSTYMYATCDSPSMTGSNGLLKEVISLGGGKRQFRWVNTHMIDYYLISVATANYIEYSNYVHPVGSDSVLFQNYIYNNPMTLPTFKGLIDTTGLTLEYFAEIFGPYPFAKQKYGHCLAPFSGGMEHQTMTSQGFFEFTIDAHELGHQWFGDYVTCQTWKDIWVNEGFASYTEYLALEHLRPSQKDAHMIDVHDFVMTQPGGSVWFTDSTNVNRIFSSRLSYNKGSAIIHTLRYVINNDSMFFLGLRTFLNTYKDATATSVNLKDVMQSVTGVNLTDWFNQWFYGEGYPTYSIRYNQVANTVYVVVNHTTSSVVTPLFKTPLDLRFTNGTTDTTIRVAISSNSDAFNFMMPNGFNVTDIEADPENWIINKSNTTIKDLSLESPSLPQVQNVYSIYPTYTNGVLTIQGPLEAIHSIQLLNLQGSLIKELTPQSYIDISFAATGTYIIQLLGKDAQIVSTQKVIKK